MNKVHLIGRLTRDVDINNSANGMMVGRYTLAVDRRKKADGENQADFISCVVFDKQAEFASKYLAKGTKVAVTGRIQTGSYTNKDGQKVYTTDVIVEEHEFCEKRSDNPQVAQPTGYAPQPQMGQPMFTQPQMAAPQYQQMPTQPQYQQMSTPGFMEIPAGNEMGIPFQ